MAKMFDIIQDVHLLYTGINGKKTYGITVKSLETVEEGYQIDFVINDYVMLHASKQTVMDTLGLNEEDYETLINKFKSCLAQSD